MKSSAGMLGGKSGLVNEVACLLSALEHGVSAILCDITNTLRYGDVCLLGASDPCPIEVKSRKSLNKRGKRQAATLERLTAFLETDQAENFRVPGMTKRVELKIPERTYRDAMNACIANAARDGWAVACPEPGLTYIATYISPTAEMFASMTGGGLQIYSMLNEDKTAGTWGIYEPFTLSVREESHLLDFIEGRLSLIVSFDVDALCTRMARPGWDVSFNPDVPAAIQFHHVETGALIGISRQFLSRIAYEFVAPSWVADSQAPRIDELNAEMLAGEHMIATSEHGHEALRIATFGSESGGHGTH